MDMVVHVEDTSPERRERLEAAETAGVPFAGHPGVRVGLYGPFDGIEEAHAWMDDNQDQLVDGYAFVSPVDQTMHEDS